ncbi:MAG: hypothetical protein NTX15_04270 [Candidatus Kapabacteria bacterium]|nr:hypothetical protein [Candidatus Kapabacteria bacterium]
MNNTNPQAELLSAYLDGEALTAAEVVIVESMLQNDPVMKREAELLQSVRTQLRTRRPHLQMRVPVDVERAIRLQLGEEVTTPEVNRGSRLFSE